MTADTSRLRGQLEARAAAPAQTGPTVLDLIERMKPQLARALPAHLNADRFARIVVTEIRRNPALAECTPESLLGACMYSAQLGLEPGPLGHVWLVPYRNRDKQVREVTWMIGYRGIIELAYRSGRVRAVRAREVCELDHFEVVYGLREDLVHRPPALGADRGGVTGVYAVAEHSDGAHSMVVLSSAQVEARRARSRAKDSGPWVTDWMAMARKTAIRALAPYLPLTVEAAEAVEADESVIRSVGGDGGGLDVEGWPTAQPPAVTAGASETPAAPATPPAQPPPPEPPPTETDQTAKLSRADHKQLRELGVDDQLRRTLVGIVTDWRTITSNELTDVDRARLLKAATLIEAGDLAVVDEGPSGKPVLIDADERIIDPPVIDRLPTPAPRGSRS